MPAAILSTHTPALFEAAVQRVVTLLAQGRVVALPTETVYGLAASAVNPEAVAGIFRIKGRPSHNPIIVHVASFDMARHCASQWPPMAEKLARAFWPGPLTLVLPKSPEIPDIVTAGGPTVAVRWPQHPFMQSVIRAAGFPVAAPSANLSNQVSPTNAQHVASQLGEAIDCIVDGGQCQVGIESTVVDVTGPVPRILRPGMISADDIRRITEDSVETGSRQEEDGAKVPLPSPGLLARHYSPRARLLLLSWTSEEELERLLASQGIRPEDRTWIIAWKRIPRSGRFPHVSVIPDDAEAFARALYAELHRCDEADARVIVVEDVPSTAEWAGIRDRLGRAATA